MMNLIEGVIKPLHTGPGPSEWASKAFPVHKGNGTSVCIVSDFKKLNRQIKHPNWPTESSDQLLLHKTFCQYGSDMWVPSNTH